jgi:hypothetical protein
VQDGGRDTGDVASLALKPELEAGAGAKNEPVEELVAEAGQRDRLRPRPAAQSLDIHECPWRQLQANRIAPELGVLAEAASKR